MSTAQLIAIIVAIVGADGLWKFIEHRFNRKDTLADRKHKSIEEFEDDLVKCCDATKKLLAYIIIPWQEHIMSREETFVGINEYKVLGGLVKVYQELDGNGTVKNQQEYIDTFQRVPDIDVEERNDVYEN